jgi:hypothetical protein
MKVFWPMLLGFFWTFFFGCFLSFGLLTFYEKRRSPIVGVSDEDRKKNTRTIQRYAVLGGVVYLSVWLITHAEWLLSHFNSKH